MDYARLLQDNFPDWNLFDPWDGYFDDCYDVDVLGSGYYSLVVQCPWDTDLVIKFGFGRGCMEKEYEDEDTAAFWQDAWLTWMSFCVWYKKNVEDTKYLPDLKYLEFGEHVYAAVMPKYKETAAQFKERTDLYTFGKKASSCLPAKESRHIDSLCQYESIMDAESKRWKPPSLIPLYYRQKEYADVKRILQHPLCPKITDLHDANVMFDWDGHAVITDPCSSSDTFTPDRVAVLREQGFTTVVAKPRTPDLNGDFYRSARNWRVGNVHKIYCDYLIHVMDKEFMDQIRRAA